ncbi:phosphoglycerate mutase family protein [Lysobacter solisilvae (ex Woo and Kim 2020)]|uniref:Histidine phosphatase family protein n=1 Tax=Agrilutibacter terrestris TaxID=2865112 RepID=A0A7H0FVQ2_9GAMM|nr:phosphoglycerate mutase family protein [Lysobacter terrestris]QNP40118.1 histidine phosphatase family protein [Lysobacter terrestris]
MLRTFIRPRLAGALLLATLLGGCATAPAATQRVSFVVVRHAEKADDGSKDPPLSAAGQARATALAASLRDAPLRAAYATGYRRTQATAAPAAQAHALAVTTYDASRPASEFAVQLRHDHRDGTVLVVGHSNTAPAIAAALCACEVAPMGDGEFDRRLTITIDARGAATLRDERY